MERLQKVLAQAGIASRRAAEQIILAGRVRVDGKIVRELGTQVDPRTNRVEVDGNKIVAEKQIYIVLHKPRGVVCTLSDPEGRPTIAELIKDAGARVVPVGRLDFHTSGALICTNDGDFAQALAHPKKHVPKVYVAKVQGAVDDEGLDKFSERIVIDGRPTQPAQVKRLRFEGDKTWLEITLSEGRNRQVRRLGEATGFPVMRLARISHAGVTSEDLRPGQWRPLSLDELIALKRDYGVPKKVRAPLFEPALGKGGWDEQPRTPGARRPEPKFSAARRKGAKPKKEAAHFDRRRTSARRDEATLLEAKPFDARPTENKRFKPDAAAPAPFNRKRAAGRDPAPRVEPARFGKGRRDDAPRGEPKRFDAKRGAPRRDDAPRGPSKTFEGKGRPPRRDQAPAPVAKPFNAAHREKKRFNAKNAEPAAFETKRPSAPNRKAPSRGPGLKGRAESGPKRGGDQDRNRGAFDAKAPREKKSTTSRSDGRGSAPRRGTSR
jgi:23S rRNA pseudouridine2605 synthase